MPTLSTDSYTIKSANLIKLLSKTSFSSLKIQDSQLLFAPSAELDSSFKDS